MRSRNRICCSSGALRRPPSPALLQFLHPSAHAPIDTDKRFLIPCLSPAPSLTTCRRLHPRKAWMFGGIACVRIPLQHPDRLDPPARPVPSYHIKVPLPPDAWRRRLLITQPEGGLATLARNTEAILQTYGTALPPRLLPAQRRLFRQPDIITAGTPHEVPAWRVCLQPRYHRLRWCSAICRRDRLDLSGQTQPSLFLVPAPRALLPDLARLPEPG